MKRLKAKLKNKVMDCDGPMLHSQQDGEFAKVRTNDTKEGDIPGDIVSLSRGFMENIYFTIR